ncbi:hypothetical protein VSR17_16875 [Cupriavidus taiwanensis]|uniref:hypothetical protein n=1 Tax=Cupriavidus taiwanensis TaxID=164546 RepID=UPI000E15BA75|nr:hypothetical protein [Cupriavidus taiwanensis]SOY48746.1 hypothetical protein CBM2588_A160032 [Cupriavidus taiwanensis]SOZ23167.1 hypothetical protein CBM2608_A220039 [Cupriavidus taiwanensis]SPA45060.1 hypothetical protein CBM2629_A190030 [Cupriavidus taiwanensis]
MSTAISVPLTNALLSTLLVKAIEAEKDLQDYIVGVLSQAVFQGKPGAQGGLDEVVESLYEVIAESQVACTVGQAWQEVHGNWKELSHGARIQVGLQFKKLVEGIAAGTRQPPGATLVVLVRLGQTAQGKAIYGKPGWLGGRYGPASEASEE